MERPIIIWLKDDGKITKETLEEVARKAYEQGYEDGKSSNWYISTPGYKYLDSINARTTTTTNPKDICVEWTCSDTCDHKAPYCG